MRRLALALALTLAMGACGPNTSVSANTTPTTTGISSPTTTGISSPTTTGISSPTATAGTSAGGVAYQVTDCHTPPVDFALLCDVYGYLQEYHVDAPLDPASLAASAALGVDSMNRSTTAGPVDSFRCAIPDPAFETTCRGLAERAATGAITLADGVEAAVSSMIKLSLDPFTYYLPPELSGALSNEGIVAVAGLLVRITDPVGSSCTVVQPPCRLEVALVVEDGPSHKAGLEPGMVITDIDGEGVDGDGLVDIAARLDGPSGTPVSVGIRTTEGATETLTIVRGDVPAPTLDVELPRPDVGYLRIPDFGAGIPTFVHQALAQLEAAGPSRIVIDLRDNPGGYVDVATSVASEFLPDGLVFRAAGRDGETDYPVQPGGLATSGVKLTVVVNSGSASAAEILAAVLQERGRATLVGAHTYGKNTVQIPFRLPNNGELRVTMARWTTPEGASVAITGLEPDVQIDIPIDATPDEVVDLALGAS